MPRLSVRSKQLAAFAVILLPVLVLLLVSFQASLARREEYVLEEQLLTAQAIAIQVDQTFDAAIGVGCAVANDRLVQTMDPSQLDPHLQELVRRHPFYHAINVWDAEGVNRGWGNVSQPAEPRIAVADMPYFRPYFQQVVATGTPTISEVFLLRRPLTGGVVAAVPIHDPDGHPIGVVTVEMRTDQLAMQYEEARLRPGQSILLTDRKGRLALHTRWLDLPYEESNAYAHLEPLRQALAGVPTQQIEYTSPLLGDSRLGAFVPTPKYRWVVGVTMNRSVALAPVQAALREQLAAFAGILLFSVVLAVVLSRFLVAPVQRLEEAAQALGRGDLTRRVHIETGDELQRLGDSFNGMASQLEQRQAQVLGLLTRERALTRIGRALVSELELERVADVVMEQSLSILGVDAVELHLADPARRELILLAYRNLTPTAVEILRRFSYDAPLLTARAARTEETQVVEDLLAAGEEFPLSRQLAEREGLRGLLAVPLCSRGHLVGVVTYTTRTPRRFSPSDLEFNAAVADLFAVSIENAHLYDQVREALRLRQEFMSAAAHELKTPVTTIKGWTELLLKVGRREERERRALETILRQSDRIERLTQDLLAVVRVRPSALALSPEQFDLNTLAQELVGRTARTTEQHQFRVETAGPLLVEADRELIGEVLSHLLENAMRYSPAGGLIEVEARRTDGEAVVSVRDHGVGIPPERQPHVFEPFYEPVPSGEPGYVGIVSVGLYLSRQVVEAHGGRIWFTSTPGEGSTFSFSLPVASKPSAPISLQQRGSGWLADGLAN